MEISGFKEEYGLIARKREYVERVLSDIMRENNYDKIIIGGMAYYNDPAMSFMTELFDKNVVNKDIIRSFKEEYAC